MNEVIRWPGPAVFEAEFAIVPGRDLFYFLIEFALGLSLNQKCSIHYHLVADRLISPRGDGGIAKNGIHFPNIGVRLLRESRFNKTAELHPGKVSGPCRARNDLLFEVANLLILLFDFGNYPLAIPIDLQAVFDFTLHLVKDITQSVVGCPYQFDNILFGPKKGSKRHWQHRKFLHHGLIDRLVGEEVVASGVIDNEGSIGDNGGQPLMMDSIDIVSTSADSDGAE